jgi:hypothetical protein
MASALHRRRQNQKVKQMASHPSREILIKPPPRRLVRFQGCRARNNLGAMRVALRHLKPKVKMAKALHAA